MIVSALNALIIGCSVGGAFILIALIIVIVYLIYHFRLCCKQTKGDKYASNITRDKVGDSSLEKKYSSQNGLPPTGLGLWTKNPSLQTAGVVPNGAPNPGQSAISAFYKSDNARGSFVRNIDKSRQKLNNNNNDLQTTATPTPFEWPSIDDVHVNQPPSNNNSYGSQARLIVTDVDRGVVGDQPRKSKPTSGPVQPAPGTSGDPGRGNKMNVEAIIEKLPSNRPMNGKMTIPPLEKKLIGEAFQFLDELE